jgi:hypothetical protein
MNKCFWFNFIGNQAGNGAKNASASQISLPSAYEATGAS